jgi:hypothetical protein
MSILEARRIGHALVLAAMPFASLLAATPAAAQDAPESVVLEPLPIFKAVCLGEGAKLTRKTASEIGFGNLPDPAQRALGKALARTPADAAKMDAPAAAAVPNVMYQIAGSQFYLLVPDKAAKPAQVPSLADSCVVLWQSAGDDDYLAARKVVLPGEDSVPMYQRPNSKPNGFVFASTVNGSARLTLTTYGGWIALRSSPDTPPVDPQKGN